jgi:hypothetical protein
MGTKLTINNIIQTIEGRNHKRNFSIRVIITTSVLLIRATVRVASHTSPIWSTRRVWMLLVHMLVITVLLSWWWMWRVEGLLILHLLLLIVAILTSIVGKLVLIHQCQSSLQGVNSINDSSNGAFHLLKSCVSGLLVLHELLGHRLHHGANLFVLTHSSSSSPTGGGGGGGGCPCFSGMVNRK